MKAVLQRVNGASVSVAGSIIGKIGTGPGDSTAAGLGLLVLLGVETGDSERDSTFLARKTLELRIFADDAGKMNLSVMDVGGTILVVSQFTLIADWKKGRRPGFSRAAAPAEGNRLYEHYVEELRRQGAKVETGLFGGDMKVSLVNDGPVTLILESRFLEEAAAQ